MALFVAADGRDEDLSLELVELDVGSRQAGRHAGNFVEQRELTEAIRTQWKRRR